MQGQHRTTQELIESNIKTVLLDLLNQLASNADLDYGLYKVEWLRSLVLRLGGTFEQALLPNLRQARDLISLMIRHNQESSDVHNNRLMIVTGNKGRPKIYISRNQLKVHLTPKIFFAKIIKLILWSNLEQKFFDLVKSSSFYAPSKYVQMPPFWFATEFNGAWVEGRK